MARAKPQFDVLSQEVAQELIEKKKDGGGKTVETIKLTSPQTGVVIGTLYSARVATHEGVRMVLQGDLAAPDEQQHRLELEGHNGNLARFCISRVHPGDPHWHYCEDMDGLKETKEAVGWLDPDINMESILDVLELYVAVQLVVTRLTYEPQLL